MQLCSALMGMPKREGSGIRGEKHFRGLRVDARFRCTLTKMVPNNAATLFRAAPGSRQK